MLLAGDTPVRELPNWRTTTTVQSATMIPSVVTLSGVYSRKRGGQPGHSELGINLSASPFDWARVAWGGVG